MHGSYRGSDHIDLCIKASDIEKGSIMKLTSVIVIFTQTGKKVIDYVGSDR